MAHALVTDAEKRPILPIKAEQMACLFPRQLINGDVVNSYFRLLERRSSLPSLPKILCLDTYFMTTLRRGGKKRAARFHRGLECEDYELIFILVHKPDVLPNAHWWLMVVDIKNKSISAYDSLLCREHRETLEEMLSYIKFLCIGKSRAMDDGQTWRLWGGRTCPKQTNGVDCGVFLCEFAEVLSRGYPINQHEMDVKEIRKRIAEALRKGMATPPTLPPPQKESPGWEFENLYWELDLMTNPDLWSVRISSVPTAPTSIPPNVSQETPMTATSEGVMDCDYQQKIAETGPLDAVVNGGNDPTNKPKEDDKEEVLSTTSPALSLSPGWSLASSIEMLTDPEEEPEMKNKVTEAVQSSIEMLTDPEEEPERKNKVAENVQSSIRTHPRKRNPRRRRRTIKVKVEGSDRLKRVNIRKLGLKPHP